MPTSIQPQPGDIEVDTGHASPAAPKRHLAIVTCMDARIDVLEAMGISLGDAHVIRNAGGLVTEDVVRSLMISQRLLGTTDVMVIQHTDCGLANLDDAVVRADVRRETGIDPPFVIGGFADLEASVRAGVAALRASRLLPKRLNIRGFIYDVETHRLRPVADLQAQGFAL